MVKPYMTEFHKYVSQGASDRIELIVNVPRETQHLGFGTGMTTVLTKELKDIAYDLLTYHVYDTHDWHLTHAYPLKFMLSPFVHINTPVQIYRFHFREAVACG